MIWNEEAVDILVNCRKRGLSCSQTALVIQEKTGQYCNKNMVVGKSSRIGLSAKSENQPRIRKKVIKPRKKPHVETRVFTKQLKDLESCDCRYPQGIGAGIRFCGQQATHGAYCERHYKLCHKEAQTWKK